MYFLCSFQKQTYNLFTLFIDKFEQRVELTFVEKNHQFVNESGKLIFQICEWDQGFIIKHLFKSTICLFIWFLTH